jgi:peptidyl-prolyl cis-trans isomerase B (cyclophilin B)
VTYSSRGISSTFVAVLVAAVVVLSGVVAVVMWPSTPNQPSASPVVASTPSNTPSVPLSATTNCVYADSQAPAAKDVGRPPNPERTPTVGTVDVVLKTNQGDIPLVLARATAPCAVQSLLFLAEKRFYDNTPCHRLTNATGLSVLQCGDPTGQGGGTPGYQFDDLMPGYLAKVSDEGMVIYPRGTVAMANAGPGTNGCQFFMVYYDSIIPADYPVLGRFDPAVVDRIAANGIIPGQYSADDGSPKVPVTIQRVVVG